MSSRIALMVGSGLSAALDLAIEWGDVEETPYGRPSGPAGAYRCGDVAVVVLARHGVGHTIAPHEVNYAANIWLLRELGAEIVLGANVVGAIQPGFRPGDIAVPEQLIDYTSGRVSTFGDTGDGIVHVDLTNPFDPELAGHLAAAASDLGLPVQRGCYGVTQGPRLETAAEIDRLERDGCTMVGMTAMPEAALAREAGLRYAVLAAAVNYAAGRSPRGASIHAELAATARLAMGRVLAVFEHCVANL